MSVNAVAVAVTVFTWHMTALVAAIGVFRVTGHELTAEPTEGWWLQRPLWLAAPGLVLARPGHRLRPLRAPDPGPAG